MGIPHGLIESLEPRSLWSTVVPGAEFAVGDPGYYWGAYGKTLASDAAGNFVTVRSDGPGGNDEVHVRLFDSAGNPRTDWVQADAPNTPWTTVPNVAMSANGSFVVSWRQTNNFVGARMFNASGQPVGPVITVEPASKSIQSLTSAAIDDSGNFVIAWAGTDKGQNGDILAQRYNAAGAPLGKHIVVNSYSLGNQGAPSIDMDADGDMLFAWVSRNQDGSGDGVYGQRLSKTGVKTGGEFQVNTTIAGDQQWPMVALDATGNAVVVWTGPDAGGVQGAWGRRYTAVGAAAGGEFRIDNPVDGGVDIPSVDMASDGRFVVGWKNYVRAYDAAGQPVGGSVHIASAGPAWYVQVAVLPDGAFVSVWARSTGWFLYGEVFNLA
jgi:hypothetical protein